MGGLGGPWLEGKGKQKGEVDKGKLMKAITIYSSGSCDAMTRIGHAQVLLEFGPVRRHVRVDLQDTTANRCIIEGLIAGAKRIKEPCSVNLVTACKIGVEGALSGKGTNADLVRALLDELRSKGCQYEFVVLEGPADYIKSKTDPGDGPLPAQVCDCLTHEPCSCGKPKYMLTDPEPVPPSPKFRQEVGKTITGKRFFEHACRCLPWEDCTCGAMTEFSWS